MADQKAQLTKIPLQASLNLNNIECDIKPYNGFHDDNALFIGGVKNNLYKKVFWEEQDKVKFITRYGKDNYYAVNKGDGKIAVFKTDEDAEELVKLIGSADKFVKNEVGKYNNDFGKKEYSNGWTVTWFNSLGDLRIALTPPGATEPVEKTVDDTACKDVRLSFIDDLVVINIYSEGKAQTLSECRTVLYHNDKFYYVVDSNSDSSFLWVNNEKVLYVQGTDKAVGMTVFDDIIHNFDFDDGTVTPKERTEESEDGTHVVVSPVKNDSSLNLLSVSNYGEPVIRINGIGVEVGIKCDTDAFGGYTDTMWNYFNGKGEMLHSEHTFMSITGDYNFGLWAGGIQEEFNDNFDLNFYGGVLFSISSAKNNVKVEHNIDRVLYEKCTDDTIYYVYNNTEYELTVKTQEDDVDFTVSDNYIFLNVDSDDNTINLKTGETFNRSNDYLLFAIPYLEENTNSSLFKSDDHYAMLATGYHVLYARDNYTDIGGVYAPFIVKKGFANPAYNYYLPKKYNNDIMVFWSDGADDNSILTVPTYVTTLFDGYDSDYEGIQYPISSDTNVIYNPTIFDKIQNTYFDEYLFDDGQYSYVSTRTQNQSIVLGYYIYTLTEFQKLFIIAGTHYAVQGDYIIKIDVDNGMVSNIQPIAYKGDLEYIGATVTQALFYSRIDRSFYTFQGDRTLTKFMESNRVSEIGATFSMPSISTVVVATNDGVLFFYQDQMIRLPLEMFDGDIPERIYYTNNSFIFDYEEYRFLRSEGYERIPISIETEFYSTDQFVEDTNDCVYIVLFDEEPIKGKVELSCMTLREGQFQSDVKVFEVTPSMFNKDQGYLRLRYQPRYQTGAFSFKIKSDYPVAGLSISHKNNNIANAKYNL